MQIMRSARWKWQSALATVLVAWLAMFAADYLYRQPDKLEQLKTINQQIAEEGLPKFTGTTHGEYTKFMQEHPFNRRPAMAEKDLKGIAKKDRPDLAMEQDFLRTMDPALGFPPRERLMQIDRDIKRRAMLQGATPSIPGIPGDALSPWVERGPSNVGGRTRALLFDPNDATNRKVFAGMVSGGIWFTNDITTNSGWTKVTGSDMLENMAMTTLAADPNNSMTFYAGTGEGYFNFDAVRGDGIFRSTDGGATWTQLASTTGSAFDYVQKIVVHPTLGIFAATRASGSNAGGVMRSTNGGTTWTKVLGSTVGGAATDRAADLEIGPDGTIYACMGIFQTDGVFRSTNGTTWTKLGDFVDANQNGTTDIARVELATAPSNANRLYAMVHKLSDDKVLGVLSSTNQGTTWTNHGQPDDADNGIPADDVARGQAWYDLIIGVDPNDADHFLFGTIDLFRSTDGGASFQQISKWSNNANLHLLPVSIVHADQHAIVFSPGSSSTAIFGTDGGVYYTNNLANSATADVFNHHAQDYNTIQNYAVAMHPTAGTDYFLGGTQDNGTRQLDAAGIDQADVEASGGDGGFCHIDQDNPLIQATAFTNNNINRSTNGGATTPFTFIIGDNSGSFINPSDYHDNLDILFSNASIRFGDSDRMKRVSNFSGAFVDTDIDLNLAGGTITHVRVSPHTTNSATLFLGTNGGGVYRVTSADGNPNTTNITGNIGVFGSVSCIEVDPNDNTENTLIATFSNFGVTSVFRTTNGGTTWQNAEGNLPDLPIRWALINPNDSRQVILATELGVFATADITVATPTWEASNTGMANVRTDMIQYRASDGTILLGTHGRGMYTGTFGAPPAGPEMDVQGGNPLVSIPDGDTTPQVADGTDFGNVNTGNMATQTYTIRNTGTQNLNLTGNPLVALTGSGDFTVTQQPGTPIAAGATTTFTVQYTPSAAGLATGTVSIANDDANENPYNYAIQGTGVVPGSDLATPGVCYGSTGNNDGGRLITINPGTGAGTAVGATGFGRVQGLAINSGRQIFGTSATNNVTQLITINASTGVGTAVGAVTGFTFVEAIAFDGADVLYGMEFGGTLITINTTTAAGTVVGPAGMSGIVGLAFDPTTGILYGSGTSGAGGTAGSNLFTINTTTGAATLVGEIAAGRNIPDIHFDATGQLYGSVGGGGGGGGPSDLYSINKTTGVGTLIGSIGIPAVSGLALFDAAAGTITVTSPNGGENWQVGSNQNITWTSNGTSGNVKLEFSTNGGATWTTIIASTPDDGSHPWTIPNTPSTNCLVRVMDTDGDPTDQSNAAFTISAAPFISVTSPNGGENWQVGSNQNVTWTSSATSGNVKLEFSTDGGANWTTIIANTPDDGTHPWTIPNTPSTNCLVRVMDTDGDPTDVSDAAFTISEPPTGLEHFTPVAATGDSRPTVIQNATIDDVAIVNGDEVGVFDGLLCVGAGKFSGTFPLTVTVWMQVTLPDQTVLPGAVAGNNMIFKVWQKNGDKELPATPTYINGLGLFGEPLTVVNPLQAVSTVTQTIAVKANQINMISLNVLPPVLSVQTVLDDLATLLVAQDDAGNFYIPSFAVNTIGDVDLSNGYQVFISGAADDQVINEGLPLVPETFTQVLSPTQLSMIGNPYQIPRAVVDVFAAITNSVVVVQDDAGQFWIPGFAVNTIGNLQPGKGYQIFVNAALNFTYPAVAALPEANVAKRSALPAPRHFKFERTGLAYGIVVEASETVLEVGDEIAVFHGDLCVGASVFNGDYPFVIAAWEGDAERGLRGFKAGRTIDVRLWKASDEQEVQAVVSFGDLAESKFRGGAISVMSIGSLASESASTPSTFSLHQNYPNPFNPETKIRYDLPAGAEVTLTVYNLEGQAIRRLVSGYRETGSHEVIWNGRDDSGRQVATGVYFYRLQAGEFRAVRKLALMK